MNASGIIALGLLSAIQGWIQGIFTFTEFSLRYQYNNDLLRILIFALLTVEA